MNFPRDESNSLKIKLSPKGFVENYRLLSPIPIIPFRKKFWKILTKFDRMIFLKLCFSNFSKSNLKLFQLGSFLILRISKLDLIKTNLISLILLKFAYFSSFFTLELFSVSGGIFKKIGPRQSYGYQERIYF